MNTIITSAKMLVALFVVSTSTLLANPAAPTKPTSFDASCYVTKANKIRLSVEKTTAQPVTISLRQVGNNDTFLNEQISKKQTKATFQLDVDQLPAGAYELEIKSKDGERMIKQVQVGPTNPVVAVERSLAIQ